VDAIPSRNQVGERPGPPLWYWSEELKIPFLRRRNVGFETGDVLQAQKPGRTFWWLFWLLTAAMVPIGVAWSRAFPTFDLAVLLIYAAGAAALYAGIQAYQARLDNQMPIILGDRARLIGPNWGDGAGELGLQLTVRNIGPGPALRCSVVVWLNRFGDCGAPADMDYVEPVELKQAPPHFRIELAGIASAEESQPVLWTQGTYVGGLTGAFWASWHFTYRDVFGRTWNNWGFTMFERPEQTLTSDFSREF